MASYLCKLLDALVNQNGNRKFMSFSTNKVSTVQKPLHQQPIITHSSEMSWEVKKTKTKRIIMTGVIILFTIVTMSAPPLLRPSRTSYAKESNRIKFQTFPPNF